MRTKHLILSLLLGISSVGTALLSLPQQKVAEVSADTTTNRTIYVKIDNNDWVNTNNPAFQIYIWGNVAPSYHNLSTFGNYNDKTFSTTISVNDNTNFNIVRVDAKTGQEKWNYSQNGTIGQNNFFVVNGDGWTPSITYGQCGSFDTGTYYVDATNTGGSFAGSTTCYMYVFNDKLGIKNAYQMTRMGESSLFYYNYTNQKYLAEGIVVVGAFGLFNPDNWNQYSLAGQSANITLYHGNVGYRAITLGSKVDGKHQCTGFETVSDGYLARAYGNYFLSLPLCYDAGGVTAQATEQWAKAKVVYNAIKDHLGTSVYIKNISYDTTSQDVDKKAMVRYDTIISKNGTDLFENFIGRTKVVNLFHIPQTNVETPNSLMIIAIVAIMCLSTTSVVTVVVIKKKRSR